MALLNSFSALCDAHYMAADHTARAKLYWALREVVGKVGGWVAGADNGVGVWGFDRGGCTIGIFGANEQDIRGIGELMN